MEESNTLERRRLAKGIKVWLDVIFYLALVAGFVVLVIGPIISLAGHEVYEITVPVGVSEDALLPEGGFDGLGFDEVRGELRFSTPRFGPNALFWILTVVTFSVGIYGLVLIRRILASTAEGFPFHPQNPRRLNHLGWIIVVTALLSTVAAYLFGRWALVQPQHADLPLYPSTEVHGGWIMCGLLILVLASVWKLAVQIAEDQSLTI